MFELSYFFGCGGKCVILFFGLLHRLQKYYVERNELYIYERITLGTYYANR